MANSISLRLKRSAVRLGPRDKIDFYRVAARPGTATSDNMEAFTETPRFALGTGEYSGNRSNPRRVTRIRRHISSLPASDSTPFAFTLNPKYWLLLPKDTLHPTIWRNLYMIPSGPGALKAVNHSIALMTGKPLFRTSSTFKFPIDYTTPFFTKVPADVIIAAKETIAKNQRLRWQMKRLIHRWRLARLKQVNQEDPVTMETPRVPVYIYDWQNRAKYVFEAQSLFRDFRTKLSHHDELFVEPKEPRNPFTNQVLTMAQVHFTMEALRRNGRTDWLLESYRSVHYTMGAFHKRFKHALGLHALKRIFSNPTSDECVDLIFDYIYSEHEQHDATMRRQDVWTWFLRNRPAHPRIVVWRNWCHAYYKAWMTESNESFRTIVEGIRTETEALVDQPMSEMIAIWRIYGAPRMATLAE